MNERAKPTATALSDSAILLTGGTSGIGLAAAKALALAGVPRLVLVGRSAERAEEAAAAVRTGNASADVRTFAADVATPAGANAAAQACHDAFGRIDCLVNTVGNDNIPKLMHKTAIEELPGIITSITSGAMLPARAVLPFMMQQGSGSIMCVASDAAKIATPGEVAIGAGMAAITMFCRGLANEAKRSGIRVNAITPSIVRGTPLYDRVMQDDLSRKLFSKAEQMAELGVVEPEDLAELVVFLASPASAKLTGQTISVNGGISAI